ncbi:14921_t:CDS:2 [Cetraspora pellucida]|uniref:14921_t:CDS:1 n=1 Tax=Cetraspora pellucida TaxID=1433469 RepID=A0A9N9JDJ3_9GLOM|nr:14921_t:CDS:2 [Cetraspora pellucida]
MSLQNISDEDVYLDELYLQPNEETDLISDNELPLYSDEQKSLNKDSYLSLDNDLYLNNESSLKNDNSLNNISSLNEKSSNVFAQNAKRKINQVKKKIKCHKWISNDNKRQQCSSVFELKTPTTNLAAHLQTEHRLDKNRPLLSLSSVQETTQPQPVQSGLLQYTLPELFSPKPQFQLQGYDTFRQKMHKAINYTENCLKNLIDSTLEFFAFTTDLWTQNYKPYIGIMNLSDKCMADVTDNASTMVKALNDIGILHVQCTAHTIHLGVTNGLKQTIDLINHTKALNAFVARKDKFRERLRLVQVEIAKEKNTSKNIKDISVLDPIFNDTVTRLQKDLAKNNEKSIRNNAKTLENLLLNEEELLGIQELVELLGPFAQVTTIIGRDHYLTFSIMLLLIKRLQEHLFQKKATLKHSIVRNVCDEIELLFGNHWEEPGVDGYIAAILNPRFKNLSFESEKLEIIKDELKCKMEDSKNIYLTTPSIENNTSFSLLNSLFEETSQPFVLLKPN